MKVSIIAAVARNGVIGLGGDLPWHLPADLAYFKKVTMGHHLVMGRRTFDSVGKPLPGRPIVVVTRGQGPFPEGIRVAPSLEDAIALCAGDEEVFIAGGAEIYRLALPVADRMYLTHIEADFEGDTKFPEFDESAWKIASEAVREPDEKNRWRARFVVYERVQIENHGRTATPRRS